MYACALHVWKKWQCKHVWWWSAPKYNQWWSYCFTPGITPPVPPAAAYRCGPALKTSEDQEASTQQTLPHRHPHPFPQSHSEQPQAVQSTLGRVTYSKGLAARRQHRSPKWPLNPIRTALKEKKKHETESLKAKICLNELYSSSLPQVLQDIKSKMEKKNPASPVYVMGGFIAKHCTLW